MLLKCFAGCPVETAILAAMNLTMADLFPAGGRGSDSSEIRLVHSNTLRPGLTLADYASDKQLPVDYLRELGLAEIHYNGVRAIRIPYRDALNNEKAVQIRIAMKGGDRFRWKKGSKPLPLHCGGWRRRNPSAILSSSRAQATPRRSSYHNIPGAGHPRRGVVAVGLGRLRPGHEFDLRCA